MEQSRGAGAAFFGWPARHRVREVRFRSEPIDGVRRLNSKSNRCLLTIATGPAPRGNGDRHSATGRSRRRARRVRRHDLGERGRGAQTALASPTRAGLAARRARGPSGGARRPARAGRRPAARRALRAVAGGGGDRHSSLRAVLALAPRRPCSTPAAATSSTVASKVTSMLGPHATQRSPELAARTPRVRRDRRGLERLRSDRDVTAASSRQELHVVTSVPTPAHIGCA